MRDLIRKLVQAYGPSGFEDQVREVIRAEVKGLADEIKVTPLGNLVAVRKGKPDGCRIMLAAHMDEIGVMVTYVDEKGFLRFTRIGGVFPLTLVGSRVAFEDGTIGVIGLERREDRSKIPSFEKLYIDVGATGRQDCPVQVGDAAVFVRPLVTQGRRLISKAMDDRIGCAILIEMMRRLESPRNEIHVVFTVQEEVGARGAQTAAYGIDPDVAIAVDISPTGDTPESGPMVVELGKGPAIMVQDRRMITHPRIRDLLVCAAENVQVPYQWEILEFGSTDASATQLVREGVPSSVLSIPCRYAHTPSEMVDEQDVEDTVKVLVEAVNQKIDL